MGNGQEVRAASRATHATEWLLADGLGGSASGTASGIASRRTQALLIAVTEQAGLRALLLGLDERLTDTQGAWDLGAGEAGAAAAPIPHGTGRGVIEGFKSDPLPTWRLRAGDVVLEKRIQVVHGHHAVLVSYRHVSGPAARLTVGPCVVCRSPLELQREDLEMRGAAQGVPGRVRIEMRPGEPRLTLWHNGAFLPAHVWRRGLSYALDGPELSREALPRDGAEAPRARGTARRRAAARPGVEDTLVPGWIDAPFVPGTPVVLVISTEEDLFRRLALEERLGTPPPRSLAECAEVIERENRERERVLRLRIVAAADFTARQAASAHNSPMARRREALVSPKDAWALPLGRALESGLTQRGHHLALLSSLPVPDERAGHPLRALPALVTLRRFDEARDVLAGEIEYLDEGHALGRFAPGVEAPREGDPEPALWLVAAADVYVRRSDDLEFLNDALYPALESVMQFYRAGTRGVRVGSNGLLETDHDGRVVARADLNALWYHAMVAMAQLARLAGRRENGAFYLAWARELQQRFGETFWDEANGRLFDRIEDGTTVAGLAPSQLLAASLYPLVLAPDRTRRLIATIERDLFTPFGLRETPRGDVARCGWLGLYYTAYVRAHARDAGAISRVHDWLESLRDSLGGRRIPGVPAWFTLREGAAPQPCGFYSTAAAGELLRAWIEELDPSAAPAMRAELVALPS